MEGRKRFGGLREVAEEEGSIPNHLSNFIPLDGLGAATLWVGNLGVDGIDDANTQGDTNEFPTESDGDEVIKAGGRDLA